jgi:hypothetical protein
MKEAEMLERLVATLKESEQSLVFGEGVVGVASRIRTVAGLRYIIYTELEKIEKARTNLIQVFTFTYSCFRLFHLFILFFLLIKFSGVCVYICSKWKR